MLEERPSDGSEDGAGSPQRAAAHVDPSPAPVDSDSDSEAALNQPYDAGTDGRREVGAVTVAPGIQPPPAERGWVGAYEWLPQHARHRPSVCPIYRPPPELGDLQSERQFCCAGRRAAGQSDADNETGYAPAQYVWPPPLPLAPVDGMRPDEATKDAIRRRVEAAAESERADRVAAEAAKERDAAALAAGQKKPVAQRFNAWLVSQGNKLDRSFVRAHASTESSVRDMLGERHQKRFEAMFRSLTAKCDKLVAAYTCKIMSGGSPVAGDLFLTEQHVCFASQVQTTVLGRPDPDAKPVRCYIQWSDVMSVRPAVALKTTDKDRPAILGLPHPCVAATALQLFTRAGSVVELIGFGGVTTNAAEALTSTCPGNAVGRCYHFIDSLWRARCSVPDRACDWGEAGGEPAAAGREGSREVLHI